MAWSVVCTCGFTLYPLYVACGGSELPTLWTLRAPSRPAPSLVNGEPGQNGQAVEPSNMVLQIIGFHTLPLTKALLVYS